MTRNFAGEIFNYTPGQLRNVFGPGGFTIDTTDRFGLGSLVPGVTANTGTSGQVKPSQPKTYGMEDLIQSIIIKNANAPTQAEEFKATVPLLKEMSIFQADLANKNAQRKFGQEMLGAGIGALGRGIQTGIAGGSPEMLAYLAQGPVRAADAYQRGITSIPRQDVPVFAARPTPDRRYFS
jgi:hypothetical protein